MHPQLFTLPGGLEVTTYGFCLMLGFLSSVWIAMRRATKLGADPDRILDASLYILFLGVGGSRVMYVAHYWQAEFADKPNPLFAAIDIRNGGLEFIGGFLGAAIGIIAYLTWTKQSKRLYLDILAPSVMWGLAIGRLGCFFNGCCFGGLCPVDDHQQPSYQWAVQFPYGSGAFVRQWENREVTVPAELITTRGIYSSLLPSRALSMSVEQREQLEGQHKELRKNRAEAKKAGKSEQELKALDARLRALMTQMATKGLVDVALVQHLPSRVAPNRVTSVSEIEDLAAKAGSLPVHPTQLYSTVHALALFALLSAVLFRRKRHGVVIGLVFLLYPPARVLLEIIRADNPHDVGGMTISQSLSLAMFLAAATYLVVLYKYLPERDPILDGQS